jgi:3-deoxy-7-phosphoheptulonate synthase
VPNGCDELLMIIVLKPHTPSATVDRMLAAIATAGCTPLHLPGSERVVLGAIGDERALAALHFEADPAVEAVKPILAPYTRVGREVHPHDTVFSVGSETIGGGRFTLIVDGSLGRAFLPEQRELVTVGYPPEAATVAAAALVVPGDRMRDGRLLDAVAARGIPVFLRRGDAATLDELLVAAEQIVAGGNGKVALVDGGIRGFEPTASRSIDFAAIAYLKERSHLPVFVDPSEAGGRSRIAPLVKAALVVGADGALVTGVLPAPLATLAQEVEALAAVAGKEFP